MRRLRGRPEGSWGERGCDRLPSRSINRLKCPSLPVIPAKAGIQEAPQIRRGVGWIPAFAGMTARQTLHSDTSSKVGVFDSHCLLRAKSIGGCEKALAHPASDL
ncbi:hypothetical protein EI613_05615 [Azospirillum sp. 412522]|nr:hypothetical protein [Azospirillum sp. 412522]